MYRYSTDPKNILEEFDTISPLYGFSKGRMDAFYRGRDKYVTILLKKLIYE
jgi:hypothetical protein